MVATFHLHYLGYKIKYGNLEVGNTTQQLLPTTRPCCSIEFIESFSFWVMLVTYNIGIYICIHIYKVSYIHSFFVTFNCNPFSVLHAKHFEILKYFCEIDESTHQVLWYFWVFILNTFSLLWSIFFLKENCVSFGLFISCLSLRYFW